MSYDINFWKQNRPLNLSAQEIYERLSRRETVEGLAKLPVPQIHQRLKRAFPEFDPSESFPLVTTSRGSIEFLWSNFHFRFDIRGEVGSDCQTLVDIMADFDCPMYDPQEGRRYDSKDGTALGEMPKFHDATPDQREQLERLKAAAIAKAAGRVQPQKKGRAAQSLFFLTALAGVCWAAVRWLA